ncbi:MAG: ABC transporter permease subunit [Rhodospirillaceae bacterium]
MASLRFSTLFSGPGPTFGTIRERTAAIRKVALPLITVGIVLWLWEETVRAAFFPTVILPPPMEVWEIFVAQRELMFGHAQKTFFECLFGFALAAAAGLGLATLITVSRIAREMLYPNLVLFQLIPTIALAPLFVLWFGVGSESRLAYAMCLALFPIVVASSTGLMNTNPYFLRLCESLTASRWQILTTVRFPFALPHIFTGMRIGLTLAIIGVVVGEFITAQSGIGYLISYASSSMALALAAIVFLLGVGLLLFVMLLLLEFVVNSFFSTRS